FLDIFQTPFGDQGTMPGIQLHASIADSILSSTFIRPAPSVSRIATVVIAAIAVGLLSAFLPFAGAAAAAAAIIGGWTWFAVSAFKTGVWPTMVPAEITDSIGLVDGAAYAYVVEEREQANIKHL